MLSSHKLLSILSNRSLELILFPTEQCNFRCVYCYEDFSIGKMRPPIVSAIKQLIARRAPELDLLKLTWFGGEPLAAKDIVVDICEYVMKLQQDYTNLRFTSNMTTNGYRLSLPVLSMLIACNVSQYQVSLDGTESEHDKTRVRLDGAGTFQQIWKNLLTAKHSDYEFLMILRLHITPENIEDMYRLVDLIKVNFGNDKRFQLFFKCIENLGGLKVNTFNVLRGQQKQEVIKNFHDYIGDAMRCVTLNQDEPYVCYAATTNSLVIRADGKIGKCTVALSDERNMVGALQDDGTVFIVNDKLSLWTRGIKSQNLAELSCPMWQMPTLIA